MRPQNLKFPFTWSQRRPYIHEGVFVVPQYYSQHEKCSMFKDLFPQNQPISVEYCSGNGDWIMEKAKRNPQQYWIAVEKKFERVRKIWSKMKNHEIKNMLIVCGEALTFTRYYIPEDCIEAAYVNFPDPWPKKKQAKHRLVQKSFVTELARVMKHHGRVTFATDDGPYSDQIIQEMCEFSRWKSCFDKPYYVSEFPNYGSSWFESLWREKGKNFYFMQFEKCL